MLSFAECFYSAWRGMDLPKRVSQWSVAEVLDWLQCQCPAHMSTLQKGIIKHDIAGRSRAPPSLHFRFAWIYILGSCLSDAMNDFNMCGWVNEQTKTCASQGRALLRLKGHHLELLGVECEEQQQEILQDLFLLRVQEELSELNDICSGHLLLCVCLFVCCDVYALWQSPV